MSLADYLAKNYLNAEGGPKPSKKRKRKEPKETTGLVIADDDLSGWTNNTAAEDENETRPTIVSSGSSEFRKAKTSNWKALSSTPSADAAQADADAILATAAAEDKARTAAEDADEAPQIINNDIHDNDNDDDDKNATYMESGAKAGLQTAEEVTAALDRRKKEEQRRFQTDDPSATGKGQETIYRDATGRIINVAMKRAEARKQAEEDDKRKAAAQEALKGDVQRRDKQARRQALDDAKYLGVARYADDTELNEELKERERWNDPAAQFLTAKKEGRSVTGKPLFQGGAPPNRYGIRPGYRWDGVDRSNGFEKEYFAAQNKRQNARDLSYAWEMDE